MSDKEESTEYTLAGSFKDVWEHDHVVSKGDNFCGPLLLAWTTNPPKRGLLLKVRILL